MIDWFGENFGGMFEWIGKKISWIVDSFKSVGKFFGFQQDDMTPTSQALIEHEASDFTTKGDTQWHNSSSLLDKPTTSMSSQAPMGVASLTNGSTININLNGGFNIATSDGKFDLLEFEAALISSVKRALARDERNMQNRMMAG